MVENVVSPRAANGLPMREKGNDDYLSTHSRQLSNRVTHRFWRNMKENLTCDTDGEGVVFEREAFTWAFRENHVYV